MDLIINAGDEIPIFRQIVRQMIECIAEGRLKPGDQLPSHRELSDQLTVAPLTVKRAYDELESLGFTQMQRGKGTFVCAVLPVPDREKQREELERTARRLISEASLAGLSFSELLTILMKLRREMKL